MNLSQVAACLGIVSINDQELYKQICKDIQRSISAHKEDASIMEFNNHLFAAFKATMRAGLSMLSTIIMKIDVQLHIDRATRTLDDFAKVWNEIRIVTGLAYLEFWNSMLPILHLMEEQCATVIGISTPWDHYAAGFVYFKRKIELTSNDQDMGISMMILHEYADNFVRVSIYTAALISTKSVPKLVKAAEQQKNSDEDDVDDEVNDEIDAEINNEIETPAGDMIDLDVDTDESSASTPEREFDDEGSWKTVIRGRNRKQRKRGLSDAGSKSPGNSDDTDDTDDGSPDKKGYNSDPDDHKETTNKYKSPRDRFRKAASVAEDVRKYKTKFCRDWGATGKCPRGDHCTFAHGPTDLRRGSSYHPSPKMSSHKANKIGKIPKVDGVQKYIAMSMTDDDDHIDHHTDHRINPDLKWKRGNTKNE